MKALETSEYCLVVSAILDLHPVENSIKHAMKYLQADERVVVGQALELRIPLSVATSGKQEDRDFWESLQAQPWASQVCFVFAAVDSAEEESQRTN